MDEIEKQDALVRIEFIRRFPKLAPLLYSIPVGEKQPESVEQWLAIMQHELNHAVLKLRNKCS
jgi:hypothetical protein